MQFLLLIYQDEITFEKLPEKEREDTLAEYVAFTDAITKSGHYKGGAPLQPVATATTLRVRDGQRQATEGPCVETAEQLGGYYFIEAANLDEAMAIAERIPAARSGAIEVRPIMAYGP